MARKTAQAFRSISEVCQWLDLQSHVLRFWESKFKEIKPVKRANGRRYYRPEDLALIGGIKVMLHDQGKTIGNVQELLKTKGRKAVELQTPAINFSAQRTPVNPAPVPNAAVQTASETPYTADRLADDIAPRLDPIESDSPVCKLIWTGAQLLLQQQYSTTAQGKVVYNRNDLADYYAQVQAIAARMREGLHNGA